ncbi:16S rRNA (cytosine(967)-C(5))-methyltransferase RsmB [Alkalicoccus halolimnae]|uniref:16S rRNA (cytosine(967)-C(5))-methyltransferase n=1 Tax=Alkalicoccus halolimnae TaxID=1667239 RepID=A0A5C7FN14_9BACI|nr:16S rRNA (cytosine(967)-C(5))-methyltransferase RsmB [Alkalicoccus halolimnae]TXF87389.1 16S rRNA (cytosine(967)-C(5))-methyltransferase RsmB [Alkalicoccus halolimnae]
MSKSNVREAALDALIKIKKNQAYSNLLLNEIINKKNLNEKDVPLFTQIVYGSIQYQRKLDYYLEKFSKKPLNKLEDWVLVLLRLSIYQLAFLDRVPDHAILNEAVTIAKKRGHKGISGMVNGILRSYLREGPPDVHDIKDPVIKLAVQTSHPDWMIARWVKHYGMETAQAIAEANNIPPVTSVRINLLKNSREEILEEMEKEGFEVELSPLLAEALRIKKGNAADSAAFQQGRISIQDEGSMLVARALAPEPGDKILDACAAPGGKTAHIAELMNNQGSVVSVDIHDHKVNLINDQAERLDLEIISALKGDARNLQGFDAESFDKILVDAPCSGLGVIQRKPDMKWTKNEADVTRLAEIQSEIIDNVWFLLKPGGRLIYSTCTIDREENESQVEKFLKAEPDAMSDNSLIEKMPETIRKGISSTSSLQLLPGKYGTDGFYIASICKVKT